MISTHILDTSLGQPAADVGVALERHEKGEWKTVADLRTNTDGRIVFNNAQEAGAYRLLFDIEPYFQRTGRESFFLKTPVVFKISDTGRKYHIPLLINPYGLSTYRGS